MAIFEREGVKLWYESHGEGPAVLLIHGLGSSGRDWEPQLPALRDFRVVTVDLRGHGRSSRAPVPISIAHFSADLSALLAHLGIDSAHVVGLSLGGGVAFQLALDDPDRVRTLTIVNSGPEAITGRLTALLVVGSRLLTIRLLGLPKLGEKVASKLFPKAADAGKLATFVERFRDNDVDSYRASLKTLVGWTVRDRLAELHMPVLIVSADQDYTPVSWKEGYAAQIRDARLVIVPDSRHALPVERPEAFNDVLTDFLGRNGGAGAAR